MGLYVIVADTIMAIYKGKIERMNKSCEEVGLKWWEWKNENVNCMCFIWGPLVGVERIIWLELEQQ